MAGGVPVVAYEGRGVNSIVLPETGMLMGRNPKALGEAVRSLLHDTETKASMTARGRNRIKELCATAVLGSKLTNWLSEVVDKHIMTSAS